MPCTEAQKAAARRYEAKMKELASLDDSFAAQRREQWRNSSKKYYEKNAEKVREKAREYNKVYKQRIKHLAELGKQVLALQLA